MRIDGRRRAFGDALRPLLVGASRVERVPGEVEVVLVEPWEVVRARADLDQIGGIPWSTQRNRRLVEEGVDVDRLVRLAVPAVLGLGDEPHHRGVALGERGLVREVGRRARRHDEREPDRARAAQTTGRERVGISRDSPGTTGDGRRLPGFLRATLVPSVTVGCDGAGDPHAHSGCPCRPWNRLAVTSPERSNTSTSRATSSTDRRHPLVEPGSPPDGRRGHRPPVHVRRSSTAHAARARTLCAQPARNHAGHGLGSGSRLRTRRSRRCRGELRPVEAWRSRDRRLRTGL